MPDPNLAEDDVHQSAPTKDNVLQRTGRGSHHAGTVWAPICSLVSQWGPPPRSCRLRHPWGGIKHTCLERLKEFWWKLTQISEKQGET